jgi:hypothetical protein
VAIVYAGVLLMSYDIVKVLYLLLVKKREVGKKGEREREEEEEEEEKEEREKERKERKRDQ